MTAATLSHDTMTPTLPFDFDFAAASQAASDARMAAADARRASDARDADRELCARYLGTWTGTFGSTKRDTSISFDDFAAAAARLAV